MNTVNDPKGEAGSKKAPMWLLPPVALEQTAWVHKLGSDKYGRLVPVLASSCGEELVEFCSCEHTIEKLPATPTAHTPREVCALSATNNSTQKHAARPATQAESSGREDFANPATTPNSSGRTPDMPSGSEKTTLIGSPTTTTGIWSAAGSEASASKFEPGIAATAGQRPCPPTACRSMTSAASSRNRAAAESAAGHLADGDSTSTTTTQPSSSEGFCATGATKALASSETIEKLLRRHSPTCSARSLQIREGHVWQRGDFNWRRTGVCATTYVSAIMRHLNAWRDGEDLDPESGLSHIAHIATSCNILLDAAACGTLQDDRNKRPATLTREEAFQKLVESPPSAYVKVVDHDLKVGDEAFVVPLHAHSFTTKIMNIVDIRGEKVYTFANGCKYTESELYTITHA